MVLSVGELEKRSLEGSFYKSNLEIVEELLDDADLDCSSQGLIPSSEEILETDSSLKSSASDYSRFLRRLRESNRPTINNMRMSMSGISKRGAMPFSSALPSSNERYSNPIPETFIYLEPRPEEGQVGTAGFDLRAGEFVAWSDHVESWQNKRFVPMADLLKMEHKRLDVGERFILEYDPEGNRVYYLVSYEGALLSPNLEILIDSKSTTGRVGAMSHFAGFTDNGNIVTIVQPYCFNLMIEAGKTRLAQAVVRYKDSLYLENADVLKSNEVRFSGDGVSLEKCMTPKGLLMQFGTGNVYRARKCNEPIDMDGTNLDWKLYFEKIEGDDHIIADKKTLYLLGSLGILDLGSVCGVLSREQDVLTGTGAWGHFAGVFQPFFRGGITMEYYSFSKRKISRGDPAGVVRFDKVEGEIRKLQGYDGAYQDQKPPRLPKMFKDD